MGGHGGDLGSRGGHRGDVGTWRGHGGTKWGVGDMEGTQRGCGDMEGTQRGCGGEAMRWQTGGDVWGVGGCTSIRGGGAGVAGPPAPIPFAFAGGALGAKEPAGLIDDARQRLQWLQCRVDRVGHVGAAGGGGHRWDIGVRWSPNVPSVALRWPQTPLFLGTTITTSTPSISRYSYVVSWHHMGLAM